MFTKALLTATILACTSVIGSACDIPDGWTPMKAEKPSDIIIAADLLGQPIPVSTQFDIDILVCGVDADEVVFDATMPAHQHGMNYTPETEALEAGRYRAIGMFFHMPGNWQISVELKDRQTQRFLLDVIAK